MDEQRTITRIRALRSKWNRTLSRIEQIDDPNRRDAACRQFTRDLEQDCAELQQIADNWGEPCMPN